MELSKVISGIKNSLPLIIVSTGDPNSIYTGSGFIYKKSGIVVTCAHVVDVEDRKGVFLQFPNNKTLYDAEVALVDREHDLCLLKFTDKESRIHLEPSEREDKVAEGMRVIFSGYPLGSSSLTTHQGIISSIVEDASGMTNFVIDGTINRGNSGGPLMDNNGKVIGVINATMRQQKETLDRVSEMIPGAISLHGLDLVTMYQAVINNLQLGIGYAVPSYYIPEHKTKKTVPQKNKPKERDK